MCTGRWYFRPSNASFTLDMNDNGRWDRGVDKFIRSISRGGLLPVVGDWNDDGKDTIGIYDPASKIFMLDVDGNRRLRINSDDYFAERGRPGDLPLAGRWRP